MEGLKRRIDVFLEEIWTTIADTRPEKFWLWEGMSMSLLKNSTHIIQTKIMNVNTKIEINPFYSAFNVFKVTFTDAAGKPYTKVSTTKIVFSNTAPDISNVVANLQKIGPGVFSVTGAYISQPGEWDIALAA